MNCICCFNKSRVIVKLLKVEYLASQRIEYFKSVNINTACVFVVSLENCIYASSMLYTVYQSFFIPS